MKIKIKNKAVISDCPVDYKNFLKKDLTISNPFFGKKLSMGLSVWGIPQYLNHYEVNKRTGDIIIPVGYLPQFLDKVLADGYNPNKIKIEDARNSCIDTQYFDGQEIKIKLRDFQEKLVDTMMGKTVGVIQAKTGSGKTISLISFILKNKERTLILVNTKELASQTLDALIKHTTLSKEDVGFIGSGKFDMKPISVGILQTLSAIKTNDSEKLQKINEYFGQVIVDETHIIPATTYYEVISSLECKYKFGFSATPFREDGLTDVIHFGVGPIIHKVPDSAVNEFLIIPTYEVVKTNFHFLYLDGNDYQNMISFLSDDEDRNKLILDTYKKSKDRPSCFLCHRTSQVEFLHKNIPNSVMLTSNMKKKDREQAMELLRSKKRIHVISTFGLFSTGVDIPFLELLYLCAPTKSTTKLKQSAGRLMRKAPGKDKAHIIDFADLNIGVLAGQAKKRKRILTNL